MGRLVDVADLPPGGMLGDFTVSLRIDVPADRVGAADTLATWFDPVRRSGFTLATVCSSPGYNGPGDELRVSFGIDNGTEPVWVDCGRPSETSNFVSNSLTVFDGSLLAATTDAASPRDWAHVFRYLGDAQWKDLGQVGAEGASGVGPMIVHQDQLYVGTWTHDWTRLASQNRDPCHVYRFVGPGEWVDCGQPGRATRLLALASYRGSLFVACDDFTVHRYAGDQTWELSATFSSLPSSLTVHGDQMFCGVHGPNDVWVYDGSHWDSLGNPLGDSTQCNQIHTMGSFNGHLHVGTWPAGRVVRRASDRAAWEDTGRLGDSTEVQALTPYNGCLYAGSIPRSEVFRYDGDNRWTSLRRFHDPAGWEPMSPEEIGELPADKQGRRVSEWSRVTSLSEHDGHLYASIGSCTGALVDAPADVRGTVHAMRAGTVATASQPLPEGLHHIAAVRRGGDLSVFVDGEVAAAAAGCIADQLRPPTAPPTIGRVGVSDVTIVARALGPDDVRSLATTAL